MPEQTKARDIGGGMGAMSHHQLGRRPVQRRHRRYHDISRFPGSRLPFDCRGNYPGAERFGQEQDIPRFGAGVGNDLVRIDYAGHCDAEFQLLVLDRMSAHNHSSRLRYFGVPAFKYLRKNPERERHRKADNIQGSQRPSPHRENIGQGIGRRDLAERKGVIHDRRKKVHRLDQRLSLADPENARVIGCTKPDQQVRVRSLRQRLKSFRQHRRRQFGGSTRAGDFGRQLDRGLFSQVVHTEGNITARAFGSNELSGIQKNASGADIKSETRQPKVLKRRQTESRQRTTGNLMGNLTQKFRLDEIVVRKGLITEAQLTEALQRQKLFGGKLGTQFVQLGYLDEATLIRLLAEKLDCEGVLLGNLDIPDHVLAYIPLTVAVARRCIPFAYDAQHNTLKIACEDPDSGDLLNELTYITNGKTIKLYVAAQLSLNKAIAKFYLGREGMADAAAQLGFADLPAESGKVPITTAAASLDDVPTRGSVLLVTDDAVSGKQIHGMLEEDNYEVVRKDSADDAIAVIGKSKFHTVLIQDTVPGDYLDLIDRLRKIAPRTRVRYYESAGSLLLNLDSGQLESDLLVRNLELFTALLSSNEGLGSNHSARVGKYVDRLCRRLELADKDRLVITNAGYLHDLARFYYGNPDHITDQRAYVQLTTKLLESLNYAPLVIEILRSMYINLREKFTKRLPIEILGGNILTVVDIFCETISPDVTLSLDKFDSVKRKYRDLIGKLFLAEVVEAFIAMIQEEILSITTLEKYSQVMIYTSQPESAPVIESRIRTAGFRTITESSYGAFIDLYRRSQPDLVILLETGGIDPIRTLVDKLLADGISFDSVPAFVLTDGSVASQMTSLLEKGIEDVIPIDDNLNVLLIKMRKIQARIEQKAREREDLLRQAGAMGHLEDMNLIDLLQALGPSRKTVKLTVTSGRQELVLYLLDGAIVFAQGNGKVGPEAVYEAVGWSSGSWNVQPVALGNLPAPNTFDPNETLLMEGCRRLDEQRAGIAAPTVNP